MGGDRVTDCGGEAVHGAGQLGAHGMKRRGITYGLLGLCWLAAAIGVRAQSGDAPDVLYVKGLTAFGQGDYAAAVRHLAEIVEFFGNEPGLEKAMEKVYYALGCAHYNAGQYEEAVETFETYARRYPGARFRDEALFRIGTAFQTREEYDKAIDGYRHLLSEAPESDFSEDAFFQIGICYMTRGESKKALRSFDEFRGNFPRSPLADLAAMFQARLLFEADELDRAIDLIATLHREANSLDSVAYINFLGMEIGDRAFANTEYELALRAYRHIRTRESILQMQRTWIQTLEERLAALNQAGGSGLAKLTRAFRERRRLEGSLHRARTLLDKLMETPSYDAGLWHRIGRCFFAVDRNWEARVAFRRVVDEADDGGIRETAHFDLILVLHRMRRFEDLIARADGYLEDFGEDPALIERGRVPTVAFMRAESYINMEQFEAAEPEMKALLTDYPDHPRRPRIEFYVALCAAMLERFEEGVERFDDWLASYPDHVLKSEVSYWKPIALFYDGHYARALPLFDDYAAAYPMSVYTPEAAFRAALCEYSLENFPSAARRLGEVLARYPDHPFRWEAMITRGDSLAALGRLEEAEAAYQAVGDAAGPYYFLALTQLAKVFRARDTIPAYTRMAKAFGTYIRHRPTSGNIIEAAHQAGWALRQIGRPEQARTLYWNIVTRYGNNRKWEGFAALLDDLARLYPEGGDASFPADLRRELGEAREKGRTTLAARLMMARAAGEDRTERLLVVHDILDRCGSDELGAGVLAFIGRTLAAAGYADRARTYYEQIVRDFPESARLPEAHANLAGMALEAGDPAAALRHAEETLAGTLDPQLFIRATFLKASCLRERGQYAEAIELYKQVLANRAAPTALKPEALLGIARSHEGRGEVRRAIPFYQRIYVLYRAYPEAVAAAYWASGRAFERLKDRAAAVRTYRELLEAENLAGLPEARKARERLAELGA